MSLVLSAISKPLEISNTDFLLGNCLFIACWQATQKRTTSAAQQEKPREILEQISGIPGLRSIVDNFDIAVESWLEETGSRSWQWEERLASFFFAYHLKFEPFPKFFIIRNCSPWFVKRSSEPRKFGCFRWVAPAVVFRFQLSANHRPREVRAQFEISSKIHRWVKLPFGDPIWSNHILWNCRGGQEKIW